MNSMRFILPIKLARATAANVEIFDSEDAARERWRAAAIAAVAGLSFGGHAAASARLFPGPPVGSKLEDRKLRGGWSFEGARELARRYVDAAGRSSTRFRPARGSNAARVT